MRSRGRRAFGLLLFFFFGLGAGDDAFLPVEARIGVVVEVGDDAKRKGLFQWVRIRPAADLASLRKVYVVVPAGAEDPGGNG